MSPWKAKSCGPPRADHSGVHIEDDAAGLENQDAGAGTLILVKTPTIARTIGEFESIHQTRCGRDLRTRLRAGSPANELRWAE